LELVVNLLGYQTVFLLTVILGEESRIEAAKALGLAAVTCIRINRLTDTE
jgi:hypothetical protein